MPLAAAISAAMLVLRDVDSGFIWGSVRGWGWVWVMLML